MEFDFLDLLGITTLIKRGKEVLGIKSEEYHSEQIKPKKFNYRPKLLSEYIGQDRAKELVNLNLEKILKIKPVHFVISGHKGAGKTTLANIISNELGANMNWYIAGAFTMDNLKQFLVRNQDSKGIEILFVDEGHNLEKQIAEYLYPIVEDFILPEGNNLKLKPFLFITATTDMNQLMKRFSPLVDRCGANIILEPYKEEEIRQILIQYNDKLYQKNISLEVYTLLSKNTRGTPRIALNFFDDFIVCEDIKKVLNAHRVIKDGLTTTDILILSHLAEIKKPVGIEALSMIAGVSKADFQYVIEPFLICNNYLTRTARGRLGTLKSEELLRSLNGS
jgi:Holliday junction DNA helicase RuvB